jgi:hypothetical protein
MKKMEEGMTIRNCQQSSVSRGQWVEEEKEEEEVKGNDLL